MRCLWTTQEEIYTLYISKEDDSFFFSIKLDIIWHKKDTIPIYKFNNRNKIAVSDFSQFLLSDVAFYLLQQTKYLVIWQK